MGRALLAFVAVVAVSLCPSNSIRLPNGYFLWKGGEDTVCIRRHGDLDIVGTKVIGYSVRGDLVIGKVSFQDVPLQYREGTREGLFLIDTRNDMVEDGLDEAELRNLLQRHGFEEIPELRPPDWEDSRIAPEALLILFVKLFQFLP